MRPPLLRVNVLERPRVFTPLGIRFWDAALDLPIQNELVVHAWARWSGMPPVRAVRSPSGVYSFHGLPGRRRSEYPAADAEHPESAPPTLDYTIAVDDPAQRFTPVAFTLTLPLGYRGIFPESSIVSQPTSPPRAFLFSTASRSVPPGTAAIRADLIDADTGRPAAWAVLRASMEGHDAVGIADQRGRAMVLMPLPTVEHLRIGSPPGAGQGSLAEHSWPVTIRIDYEPAALRYPFAGSADLDRTWVERPSLKSILEEQRAALIVTEEGSSPADEWRGDLAFDEELRLRTLRSDGSGSSTVWIVAAAPSLP